MQERLLFGFIPIYGLLISLGIFLGVMLVHRQEKEKGFPEDTAFDLALWIIPLAILGARLYYVAFQWENYQDNLLSVFYVWEGGMAIYGGIIGGVIGGAIMAKRRKLSFWKLADAVAPVLLLGQCIGRWGNFINGEAYGYAIENPALWFFPLAVNIGGVWHMATFVYESFWNFIGFWILWLNRKKVRRDGNLFFCYLVWYGFGRSIIEGMRTDSLMLGPLRVSQWLSILLVISGVVCLVLRNKKRASRPESPEKGI